MNLKPILYDWGGANEALFKAVNGAFHSPAYDFWMVWGSILGHYTMFYWYAIPFALFGIGRIFYMRYSFPNEYAPIRDAWVKTIITLFLVYWGDHYWVGPLKDYFHYARPFILLPQDQIHLVRVDVSVKEYYRSCPSGHTIFAMMMVAAIWPVLESVGGLLAISYFCWVAWSRLALGMHFPADLLYGALFSLISVLITRAAVTRIYDHILARILARKALQKKQASV
jgi:membrane-associated phospholipid phosphatase